VGMVGMGQVEDRGKGDKAGQLGKVDMVRKVRVLA
jgi:hypothetical protein